MVVATTCKDNMIFPHFGKSEAFKIYHDETGEVIPTNGVGHEALALWLKERGVEVLLCGGIGSHAMQALGQQGIKVISGVVGDCDVAYKRYKEGRLVSLGINCDCHGHHD